MEAPQRVYDALDARNYKAALKLCDKNAKKNPVLAALRCLTLQRMRRLSEAAEACNELVTKGYTDENDGMDGQQPRNTHVLRNYVHEFAHYQKQSSMWSNNKACLAQVEGNVVFNGPRVRRPASLHRPL